MSRKVNYKKASTYYLVGNLFNKGMSFITVPIFTRILSTSDYGVITTYNSWIMILSMVIGFAMHMGIRAAFIDYEDKIDDFMSVTTTFTLECGVVLTAMVLGASLFIKTDLSMTLIILCMLHGLAAALIQNYTHYLMMRYQYKFRTALMILPNLISVILSVGVILFVIKSEKYMGRIVPTAAVNIFFGLLIVLLVYRKSHMLFNKEYLKYGLAVSAPLVLHGIALNVLSQSDRVMITSLADSSQTGIYSLIYNFSMLATVITTSLDGVWIPWFTERYKEKKINEVNKFAVDYVNLITYVMIALLMIGPEVVKILADERYWEGISIIPPVVLANYIIFVYTMYVNVEHFHKKTIFITINTIVAAVANLILNFIFIPYFGYVAAAYTTLASYLIALVLHARYSKKLEKGLYPIKMFLPSLIHIVAAVSVFYVFMNLMVVRWIVVAVYLGVMLFLNRKTVLRFMPKLSMLKRSNNKS